MGDWGFLIYFAIIPAIISSIISFLLLAFFMKLQSFRNFLTSHYFWLAWLFPYCLLLIIAYFTSEWRLLEFYICALTLPIVYQLRKWYITTNKENEIINDFSIWIIFVSILSFFIHLGMIALYLLLTIQG